MDTIEITLLCLLAAAPIASGTHWDTAVVEAGNTDRVATPVYVDTDYKNLTAASPFAVNSSLGWEPAQVEILDSGRARIWWIVRDLPAGQTRTYNLAPAQEPSDKHFNWIKTPGESMDLLYGNHPVLQYVCVPYSAEDVEGTKKPFHHVFNPAGTRFITKGVGGLYSHHRGIFFGYNKISAGGESYDVWHGANGEHQQHAEVLEETIGPVAGGHTLRIDWNDREGKPFAEETRRLRAFLQPGGEILVDFQSTLRSLRGPIRLDGDRQHAGVQFRPSQAVAEHQETTRYLRPAAWSHLPPEKEFNAEDYQDLTWNAVQYRIAEENYTVAYLTDPKNPDNAKFSERLYGRFGEFFTYDLSPDEPLRVHYRWWIRDSHDLNREEIERRYQDLAALPKVRFETPSR